MVVFFLYPWTSGALGSRDIDFFVADSDCELDVDGDDIGPNSNKGEEPRGTDGQYVNNNQEREPVDRTTRDGGPLFLDESDSEAISIEASSVEVELETLNSSHNEPQRLCIYPSDARNRFRCLGDSRVGDSCRNGISKMGNIVPLIRRVQGCLRHSRRSKITRNLSRTVWTSFPFYWWGPIWCYSKCPYDAIGQTELQIYNYKLIRDLQHLLSVTFHGATNHLEEVKLIGKAPIEYSYSCYSISLVGQDFGWQLRLRVLAWQTQHGNWFTGRKALFQWGPEDEDEYLFPEPKSSGILFRSYAFEYLRYLTDLTGQN